MEEAPVRTGRTSQALREEFPGLALRYLTVEAEPGRSTSGAKERLRYLSDRLHGQRALNLRREPIVSAYRVFFRQIGLDPDEFRTPIEAAVLERLRAGAVQVGSDLERGHRGARVQVLAFAAPTRPDRHAHGLVAGQGLLGLSMTSGARASCRDPEPRSTALA
jgi:hypothetical protein